MKHIEFPSPTLAADEPNGLLAMGGDLSVPRLIEAYRQGIFPWFDSDAGPILWWSPNPRGVLEPGRVKVTRSLGKRIRRGDYRCTMDTAFGDVIAQCAGTRPGVRGTWITPNMRKAYVQLFDAGYAHSVEAWADGELVGGLYGVSLGKIFFGESMFARCSDASKIALVHLDRQLERWAFELIDCQMMNPHLASLGAQPMERSLFLAHLSDNRRHPTRRGRWAFDERSNEQHEFQQGSQQE